ncbi:MAG TPA: ArgR family transcriptional regulator [Terriglobia bacterium]|nr:ArgR family transcriptional regulator [Terriglobia bacterium]
MDHLYRRNLILEILRAGDVGTQADLKRRLAKRGIRVTQATLSRDLEEMGVVKMREGYRVGEAMAAAAPPQPTLSVILKEFVRDVRLASNLVLVKTHPGNAHSVAVSLDAEKWPEVVGTIAGDDTIFIATPGAREAAHIRKKIFDLLAG